MSTLPVRTAHPPGSAGAAPLNDVLIRALLRLPTPYTPVWLMRQAGRYLPEYRATRARAGSFLALAKTPELACEVTLQPLDRYPLLDAAILFSDILTVPDAMGLGLYFADGEGPRFARTVLSEADVAALAVPDMASDLGYVMEAVSLIRTTLKGRVPLIGFSGSPWTLACYMVEGGGSEDFRKVKTLLYKRPDLMLRLLQRNAEAVAAYLNAQIEAGAQAVMIFDTWGGVLPDGLFQQFSLAPMRWVHDHLLRERTEQGQRSPVPSIVFTKGGGLWLEELASTGCDALGVDWTVNLGAARARVGSRVALQGNLDPMALMADPGQVQGQALRVLESFGLPQDGFAHVFNLGHGISQHTPPESVEALLETVRTYSTRQREQAQLAVMHNSGAP
ncbi:MAG: uroporphyrinogen decarboxylase [Betaproteobacteria bacterium]|nr:uroporphyrinogen decarboxylase [Betaproteobacteria bacterium]